MWKWIGGVVLAIVLLLVGASWWGYRALTAAGDTATVTIAATPERVFASLATHDSLRYWWWTSGSEMPATGHGPLAAGDTLPVERGSSFGRAPRFAWVTTEIKPNQLLVLALRSDSSGRVLATRRDSIVPLGDSTAVVSTIASPMMESLARGETASTASGALVDMSSKMLISSFRAQAKLGLTRLKNHIEGGPNAPVRP